MSAWDTAASAVAALTAEESDAVTAVRSALVAKGWDNERLLRSELVATTLISKCRVDKAVKSHEKFMQTVASFELGKTAEDARRMYDPAAWPPRLREILEARYRVCERDADGRSVMWIVGGGTSVEEEQDHIHASVVYFMAVHADVVSLREGVTFVIDAAATPERKVGNESKLQKARQAFPLRPQHFFILGASWTKRLFINALLKIAGTLSNNKVVQRIKFANLDEVEKAVPRASFPLDRGGSGSRPLVAEWVEARLSTFPGCGSRVGANKSPSDGKHSISYADLAPGQR